MAEVNELNQLLAAEREKTANLAQALARTVERVIELEAQMGQACAICHGSGWIPGIAHAEGPLDEMPCPGCRVTDLTNNTTEGTR